MNKDIICSLPNMCFAVIVLLSVWW